MNTFAMEFDAKRRCFHRQEFAVPEVLPGELLVRVTCTTICGSDLHTFLGRRSAPDQSILGHEIIGELVGWADGETPLDFHGERLTVGQRVTWAMAFGCGTCFSCRRRLNQKCDSLFKYGHEAAKPNRPTGGLSEYCLLLPGTPVFRVPDSLSDEAACPANCATATVNAAFRLIRETHSVQGATVLVVGAGMLGLTAVAHACDSGARNIVVSDGNSERLAIAKEFGSTHAIESDQQEDVASDVRSITQGRGADIVIDFAGVTAAVETCLASVRVGGCVLLAGSVFPTEDICIQPEWMVRNMLTLRGLHNYLPEDLDEALRFLERTRHRFPFERLVERSFPLSETSSAFKYACEHRPVRVAVKPSIPPPIHQAGRI